VASNPVGGKERRQWKPSQNQDTRKLNAAYILTAFWKLNGSRILEKMLQQRMHIAAHILTAFWKLNRSRILEKMKERRRYFAPRYKYPKNCCLLADRGGDRNWMY